MQLGWLSDMLVLFCCRGQASRQGICDSPPEPSPALCARLPRQLRLEGCIAIWLQDDEEGEPISLEAADVSLGWLLYALAGIYYTRS